MKRFMSRMRLLLLEASAAPTSAFIICSWSCNMREKKRHSTKAAGGTKLSRKATYMYMWHVRCASCASARWGSSRRNWPGTSRSPPLWARRALRLRPSSTLRGTGPSATSCPDTSLYSEHILTLYQ